MSALARLCAPFRLGSVPDICRARWVAHAATRQVTGAEAPAAAVELKLALCQELLLQPRYGGEDGITLATEVHSEAAPALRVSTAMMSKRVYIDLRLHHLCCGCLRGRFGAYLWSKEQRRTRCANSQRDEALHELGWPSKHGHTSATGCGQTNNTRYNPRRKFE